MSPEQMEEQRQRRLAAGRDYYNKRKDNPEFRARIRENGRRSTKNQMADPAAVARRIARRRKYYIARSQESRKVYYARNVDRRRRRVEKIHQYKVAKGCSACGYRTHGSALDFHHIDPVGKYRTVSQLVAGSLRLLFKEIRKCELLCANCHRVETFKASRCEPANDNTPTPLEISA